MNSRKRKRVVSQLFYGRFHNAGFFWRSAEENAWLNAAPVGREFGSPDFDRLMQRDYAAMRANLSSLVEECSALPENMDSSSKVDEPQHVVNVQLALHELGHDVGLPVAARVWRHHSSSLNTDWASGAETAASARWRLLAYCTRKPLEYDAL